MKGRLSGTAVSGVALVGAFAAVAIAAPTATFSLSNPVSGKPTHVILDVKGDQSASDQIPQSIAVKAARGLQVDPLAVAKLCTKSEADSDSCPAESRIGGGEAVIQANGPGVPLNGQYTANGDLFLARPQQKGDIAGLVARFSYSGFSIHAIGRVFRIPSGPFGVETFFGGLDKAKPPPGYSAKLKSVHMSFGAHRTVKKKRKHKKPKKVTHYLIRNPSTCPGSWPWEVVVAYPSGQPTVLDGSVTCRSQ